MTKYEEAAYKRLLRLEKQYEKKIQKVLKRALDTMRGEMQTIYEKYAVNGVLTKAEMTRYNRYAAMEKEMLSALSPSVTSAINTIDKLTPEQYQAAFFNYSWAVDNMTGLRLNYGTINLPAVLENLDNEFKKISRERLRFLSKTRIRAALNDGLVMGKSYPKMARDIRNAINGTLSDALRIVRTEGQTAVNAGQADVYDRAIEQGVEGNVIWDATLDDKTRPDHAAKDGEVKAADGTYDALDGVRPRYPLDENLSAAQRINCRCNERFEIEGYSPQLRRTREQGLIPDQTYAQWALNFKPAVKTASKSIDELKKELEILKANRIALRKMTRDVKVETIRLNARNKG